MSDADDRRLERGTAAQPGAGDALTLDHLEIGYRVRGKMQRIVRDVSLHVSRGESFGLVGESGCGKSTIALAIVRYLARNGSVTDGRIEIDGRDVLALRGEDLRRLRARTVSMVYQEPGRALNPSLIIGRSTSRRPPWMRPSRPRCWTSSARCAPRRARRCCSSATTWA
jgi:peptide/nickel transport system ATP-binding protein